MGLLDVPVYPLRPLRRMRGDDDLSLLPLNHYHNTVFSSVNGFACHAIFVVEIGPVLLQGESRSFTLANASEVAGCVVLCIACATDTIFLLRICICVCRSRFSDVPCILATLRSDFGRCPRHCAARMWCLTRHSGTARSHALASRRSSTLM